MKNAKTECMNPLRNETSPPLMMKTSGSGPVTQP